MINNFYRKKLGMHLVRVSPVTFIVIARASGIFDHIIGRRKELADDAQAGGIVADGRGNYFCAPAVSELYNSR